MLYVSIYDPPSYAPLLASSGGRAPPRSDPLGNARNLLSVKNESDWTVWLRDFGRSLDAERISVVFFTKAIKPDLLFQAHYPEPHQRFSFLRKLHNTTILEQATAHPTRAFTLKNLVNDPILNLSGPCHVLTMAVSFDNVDALFILRRAGDRPFEDSSLTALESCSEELTRAVQTHVREYRALWNYKPCEGAFELPHLGIMVIDAQLNVHYASKLAQDILSRSRELWLAQDKLQARHKTASDLEDAVKSSLAHPEEYTGLSIALRAARRPYPIIITNIRHQNEGGWIAPRHVLLVIGDPECVSKLEVDLSLLQQCHGFSAAEARLIWAIATGQRIRTYAKNNDLSIETCRTQLSNAGRRIGHQRQLDLSRFIIMSPGFWSARRSREK